MHDERWEEMQLELVRVGPSPIAGQGLFAAVDLKKAMRIIEYRGEKIAKAEGARRVAAGNAYIFELNEHYDIDGSALHNTARYSNHSCDPNCEVHIISRAIWVVALRDIQAGEELTYNYGYGYDAQDYTNFPCTCGAKNCCGYILDRQYWGLIKASR
jgi:SET domain-containing protein